MSTKRFNPDFPIVVGLCGQAGTGKTSVARNFVPADALKMHTEQMLVVDHMFFAMPLYEMSSVKLKIEGAERRERILYGIHEVLFDLYGKSPLYGLPPYDHLNELVHSIYNMPIAVDGKPRTFLQSAGSLCRTIDRDCFVKWMNRKVIANGMRWKEDDYTYIAIVSDVRFPNEAEWVANHPNGILIKYECEDHIRCERIEKRDGVPMTLEQMNHESEKIDDIDPSLYHTVINSSMMTLETQAEVTKQNIIETFSLIPF